MVPTLPCLIAIFFMLLERLVPEIHYWFHVWLFCLVYSIGSFVLIVVIQSIEVCFVAFWIIQAIRHKMLNGVLLGFLLVYRLLVLPTILWIVLLFTYPVFLYSCLLYPVKLYFYFEICMLLAIFWIFLTISNIVLHFFHPYLCF